MEEKIDKEVIQPLSKVDLLGARKDSFLASINSSYPDFKEVNEIVFDSLVSITKENPQQLVDLSKEFIRNNPSLTTLIANYPLIGKKDKSLKDKLEIIALSWEVTPLLKLAAQTVSANRVAYSSLKESKQILKYFRKLGLNSHDKEAVRKVRNAVKHKVDLVGGYIVDEEGKNIILISEIDSLYKKIGGIYNWWLQNIIFQSFYHPKLGLLIIYSLVDEVKNDSSFYKTKVKELKSVFPDFFRLFENKEQKKKKTKTSFKEKVKNLRLKMNGLIFRLFSPCKYMLSKAIFDTLVKALVGLVQNKIDEIITESKSITEKLTDTHDIESFGKISEWLEHNKTKLQTAFKGEQKSRMFKRMLNHMPHLYETFHQKK